MAIEINYLTPLIEVFNMPRSLAFYRDLLGFEVASDSGNDDDSSWVWLRRNGLNLMLNDQYEPGSVPEAPPAERTKWHHDTCLYFGGSPMRRMSIFGQKVSSWNRRKTLRMECGSSI